MTGEIEMDQEDSWRERLFRVALTIAACGLGCWLYWHYVVDTAFVEIELKVEQPAEFKLYWAAPGAQYAEKNMAVIQVTPNQEHYGFLFTDLAGVERIRVDTHNYEGKAKLKSLSITQPGWKPIILTGGDALKVLRPLGQIEQVQVDDTGIDVISTGIDPNFELIPDHQPEKLEMVWLLIRLFVVVVLIFPVAWFCKNLVKQYRFVPLMLFGVLLLIMVMAATSKRNAHPDEYVHLDAANYYQDNWLPPVIGAPEVSNTYSVYGVSRLNNGEVYYLFAGKFDKLLDGLHLPEPLGMRLFNVFLFSLIIWYTINHKASRPVALPFLISPQIWYLFSYCDSDAFALFVTFVAACQLIDPKSLLHRYLLGENRRSKCIGLLLLGLLLGVTLLLKKNYLVFTGFFFFCLIVKLLFTPEFYWERRDAIRRALLLLLAALVVFGLRTGLDYVVNGQDRQQKIMAMRETMAKPEYKPSTPLEEKHIYLNRKARGTTLTQVVTVDRWFEKTFQSGFGFYGYFTIHGSSIYYDLVRWSGVLLLAYLLISLFLKGGWLGWGVGITALGASAALIGASVYHSWVVDFQTQGRYLFPLVPILGVLCGWFVHCYKHRLLFLGCTAMYIMGLYSFIYDALLRIPKIPY